EKNQADSHIFVTTDDAGTVYADPANANWVEYGQQSGEITAIKFVNDSLVPDEFMNFTVHASTQGMGNNTEIFNNLLAGHADGFSLPVPAVAPVRTEVYDTGISGTLWRDRNENGSIDVDETVRFSGATLTLTNSEGETVETTSTDEQGQYHFTHKPDGDYDITVTDKSGIPVKFHYTTDEKRHAHVDAEHR
ncbi:SdrD B-like domain-containing protein, partial [Actinomyces vulturis]|uniref:SdrD B-like domain-containing protein n=1 Tax=Actinomyces vulturis TaxID=1857645 RepID=UPI0011464CB7